jgi:hypothetical protein
LHYHLAVTYHPPTNPHTHSPTNPPDPTLAHTHSRQLGGTFSLDQFTVGSPLSDGDDDESRRTQVPQAARSEANAAESGDRTAPPGVSAL